MYIELLGLANFRNYEKLNFRPSSGLNILYGMNGQGKSAVLEAIYLLATSKSHRTSRDMDLIRVGESVARAWVEVKRTERNDVSLEIALSRTEKKSIKIDTVRQKKIGDIAGKLNAVIFSSSDIDMIRGEPQLRRRFLNLEVSQVSPQYVYAFGRYKRVLQQRNNLLKEIKLGMASNGLEVWDNQLAEYGAEVISRRAEFVRFLSEAASRIYSMLSDNAERFDIKYRPSPAVGDSLSVKEIKSVFLKELNGRRETEKSRGVTTVGPHRDDISLTIAGLPAREFASQGQQRTAAVSMKLAEIELMEKTVGESPVVLLDDVAAELDEVRRSRVLEHTAGRCQTLVTTTDLYELSDELKKNAELFEVKSGMVIKV